MYDVDEKRCHKVFKICKKYLTHYQNSVFRGKITPSNLVKLRSEIKRVTNKNFDKIAIIKMINQHVFDEEWIGIKEEEGEGMLL